MRSYQRYCVLAILLALGLLLVKLSDSPAPILRTSKGSEQRPIEAAFEKIHLRMTKKELHKLMAPFRKVFTGHDQWPCWTDGHLWARLTLDLEGEELDGPWVVLRKELTEKQIVDDEIRWVVVKHSDSVEANSDAFRL